MDYYEALGVDKTATQEEIKKAYKDKSKQYHPDSNSDIDVDLKEEMIRNINSAKILLDPEKRKRYDEGNYNESGIDVVFNAVVKMVLQQINASVFSNEDIWRNMIEENESKIEKTKFVLHTACEMGKSIKALMNKDTVVGKVAASEYSNLLVSIQSAHNQWNLDRRIRKFLEKDCDCLDELFGSEESVVSTNNYYDVLWKQLQ